MSAATYRDESGKLAAGVMAVAVHVAFFVLLVVGVSWQRKPPEAVVVELWNNLPPVPVVKPPEPPPKLEVKPPPPQPPQIKPEPKVEAKPAPEPKPIAKPDIALEKEKQEKARREREEKEKIEQKKRDDQAKADARKREEAEKQKLAALEADRAAKEAERVRLEKEQQEAVQRLQQQQAAAQRAANEKYIADIRNKIRRNLVVPPDIKGNPQVEFDVVLLPTGDVLGVKLKKSSQHAAYDGAVERAILRAQPLPVPKDPNVFKDFRELNLQFRPNE